MNANALHDWLEDHGTDFGWVRRFDLNALQEAVNEGDVGVICAQRKDLNRPGHISVVVPETKDHVAFRRGGDVLRPLQSQAGSRNAKYATGTYSWWLGEQFDKFGFWTAA
jgi:hypothetical protein